MRFFGGWEYETDDAFKPDFAKIGYTKGDAKFYPLKDIPEEIPMITQERVYTSPIWYEPEKRRNYIVPGAVRLIAADR